MTVVRIVKDWDWPDLLRQIPGGKGRWGEISFTLEAEEECDFLVVLNNRLERPVTTLCPPEHVWMIVQEPYCPGLTDWVMEHHTPFARVYTHNPLPDTPTTRYLTAPPAIPWHVNKTYDELVSCPLPRKTKTLSWIVGAAKDLPGHLQRLAFLETIKKNSLPVDLFGRAVHPIDDKWDALAPYYFSLAIENNSGPDMWTEKLADCFLGWCVPFYYGCTNLENYFPKEAFIPIDITDPEKAMATIYREARPEHWQARLPGLIKARELILDRYQLFPFLAGEIKLRCGENAAKEHVTIPAYKRSLRARLSRLLYKLKKAQIDCQANQ